MEGQEEDIIEKPRLNSRQRSKTTLMVFEKEEHKDKNYDEVEFGVKRRASRLLTENILGYLPSPSEVQPDSGLLKPNENPTTAATNQITSAPEEFSVSNQQEDHNEQSQVNFDEPEKWDNTKLTYKENKVRPGSYQLESPQQVSISNQLSLDFFFIIFFF